jgi:hypothetical protein
MQFLEMFVMETHLDRLIQSFKQILQQLEALEAVFTALSVQQRQPKIAVFKRTDLPES